ncbi:MAG: insulinase family protein [Deltaproteobacteria bacterium]|nr:MAG: insulinase family protein [Deltaproteobacteria bacterium]
MPRRLATLLAALAVLPRLALALELPVVARTLPNGLRVLVHEDHSAPVVSSYVFYHVGSRNEVRGATGISHLFEHMMFNGGKKFGRGVFDELIEGNGGSTNGYTTRDYTAYLNNFPREALPIVLDLESDRNNATLVLAGDVDPQDAFRLVERDFGAIPRRRPPLPVDATEPPQDGERRVVVRKNAELPAVMIGYHAPRALDADRAPLDVVERLLSGGESARLHQDLVRRHEVATAVEANNTWGIDPDLFWIYAQARPKRTAAALEERIDAVVEGLQAKRVPDDELAKAKTQLRAEYVEGLKTVSGKANKLGFFETVFGDYRALFGLEDAWRAVTADDVQRVARTYLVPTHRTVVVLEPVPAPGRPAASRAPRPGGVS